MDPKNYLRQSDAPSFPEAAMNVASATIFGKINALAEEPVVTELGDQSAAASSPAAFASPASFAERATKRDLQDPQDSQQSKRSR